MSRLGPDKRRTPRITHEVVDQVLSLPPRLSLDFGPAADQRGLSCWRLDRVEKTLPCFDRHLLWDARSRLAQLDLIAYRPWRHGDPDGCYQVLSVQRPPLDRLSPELHAALTKVLRRLDAPTVQP